ncbi:agmatinase [Nakamurella leprariae]|uniref:Agmatinase n=1 Tax=Nakamurella leprariae TaxID=2803911 RepID=A0A939C0S4_9ACTN|nr:agmatinase [Nakamurella leprariae]MBM9469525.1 agmatinase [Nakamurella leprariae]
MTDPRPYVPPAVPRVQHSPTEPLGPVNSAITPRYAGFATFARLPRIDEVPAADIAVLGVPFDTGVSYRPGARFGPAAIRETSRLLRPYHPALDTSPFREAQVVDAGDLAVNPFDIGAALETVDENLSAMLAAGITPLMIGGDHTIALPALRAMHRAHGPVAVLHFDAHLDTWDTYFGADYTHGTPFRRASEEGLLDLDALSHVGTRGPLYGAEDLTEDRRLGFGIVTSAEVGKRGIDEVVAALRERIGDRPLYVSIDIDVLDPAHAPGTGTPEAGGMTSRELLEMLRGLDGLNLVGADVVEVAPAYDHADITSVAACHVGYDLLTLMARRHARSRAEAAVTRNGATALTGV